MPRMKLPEESVPGWIVPALKQGVLKVVAPVIPKLPSELALLL